MVEINNESTTRNIHKLGDVGKLNFCTFTQNWNLISANPDNPSSISHGKKMIDGKKYIFSFGGTEQGDLKAQKDVGKQIFQFLSKLDNE